MKNSLLLQLSSLDPLKLHKEQSPSRFSILTERLAPIVFQSEVSGSDKAVSEYKMCIADIKVQEYIRDFDRTQRVDSGFWSKVLSMRDHDNSVKFPNLRKVVHSALALAHGNADVERGFSINSHSVVTNARVSLKLTSVNGLRTIIDHINRHGGPSSIHNISIIKVST